jgi:hypothetical protein
MRQIRGVEGEAVVSYCEPLTTTEMVYHRLSHQVNKMKIISVFYNSSMRVPSEVDLNHRFRLKFTLLSSFLHFVYAQLR